MSKRSELLSLLENDPFGLLLKHLPKKSLGVEDQILISSFEEIHDFVEEFKKEPQSNLGNIIEFQLFSRLKAIRSDSSKIKVLKNYDFLGLLNAPSIKEITIKDIISDDPFGLLNDELDTDIFSLKHVRPVERIKPDYLSRRKICIDFARYKDMFAALHDELASKKRRLVKYKPSDLRENSFFVLDGILLYLSSIEGTTDVYEYSSGERERFDGRTLCIFDNGTQSDMLFRSLDKAMQIDGYCISDVNDVSSESIAITGSDILNGYIYVLKSSNPNVQEIQNLYKIGHTTGLVSERIKNARNQSTYLFHDVEIISTFRCFNIQSYNLEQVIHSFFSSVKLDIELLDNTRNIYKPREWFNVELSVIEDAINLIISNKINDYTFDAQINRIIKNN